MLQHTDPLSRICLLAKRTATEARVLVPRRGTQANHLLTGEKDMNAATKSQEAESVSDFLEKESTKEMACLIKALPESNQQFLHGMAVAFSLQASKKATA